MLQALEKWAEDQWITSNFGDRRRTKRAVKIAVDLIKNPSESLPCQLSKWKDLKGAYRFFNSDQITHDSIQKNHKENVLKAAFKESLVLIIQDTSELDYATHLATTGLGPIGNYKAQGLFIHSALAVSYSSDNLKILGLAHQTAWVRDESIDRKDETRAQRKNRSRESSLWKDTLLAISKPQNSQWVSIGDRANDVFDFFIFCENNQWDYLIRATQDRSIIINNGKNSHLKQWARSLPCTSNKTIYLRSRKDFPAQEINLNISWDKVSILYPKLYGKQFENIQVEAWCIRCWENKVDGIEWILLTNIPILDDQSALEKINWYSNRWIIEEYHKCLKTGCSIEKRQLRTAKGLLAILGFLSVIAIKLLEIKFIVRYAPNDLAIHHIPNIELQLITKYFGLNKHTILLKEYWHKVANLGGFIGRKSDKDPGWQTLWKGQLRLLDMINGAISIQNCG